MRFYQLIYFAKSDQLLPDEGAILDTSATTTEWFGSERDAVRRRIALLDAGLLAGKKRDQVIHLIDVPTTKPELLAFLRAEVA